MFFAPRLARAGRRGDGEQAGVRENTRLGLRCAVTGASKTVTRGNCRCFSCRRLSGHVSGRLCLHLRLRSPTPVEHICDTAAVFGLGRSDRTVGGRRDTRARRVFLPYRKDAGPVFRSTDHVQGFGATFCGERISWTAGDDGGVCAEGEGSGWFWVVAILTDGVIVPDRVALLLVKPNG